MIRAERSNFDSIAPSRPLRAYRFAAAPILCVLGLSTVTTAVHAQTSGSNGTHDPSRIIESEGRYYFYGTGGGGASSPDGFVWSGASSPFAGGTPAEATAAVGSNNGGIWAPDVIYLNGQYYFYYAIANTDSSLTSKTKPCAIGLFTSPTLNPKSPNYKWTDRGIVVSSGNPTTHAPADYCTIDPAPGLDAQGNLWLSWGSGYGKGSVPTIYITRLDNTTGLASSTDPVKPGHALGPMGAVEASYFYYKDSYYYLFWNSGGCCSGASSTYEIHVARSQNILGPYSESPQMFYKSNGGIHGPGQIGIYDKCGYNRFTYHYYPNSGGSILGMNELSFAGGWPVAGPVSTTPLKPCGDYGGDAGPGSSGGSGDAGIPDDATADLDGAVTQGPETGGEFSGGTGSSGNADQNPNGGGSTGTASGSSLNADDGGTSGSSGGPSEPSSGSSGGGGGAGTGAGVATGSASGDASASGDHSTSGGCSVARLGARGEAANGEIALLFGLALEAARRARTRKGRKARAASPRS